MNEDTPAPDEEPVSTPTPIPAAVPVAAQPEAKKPQATTVAHGTLIMGTYEIEKLINSGGMGEVYRGRNIHNDEPVAIKIVLPSLAHDAKIVALFQKESTVLSRLSHEAIVRYHVFTNDPTIGRPCMVMEFVSGQALSDRIEQGAMPTDLVKTMLRRVASGLDKAHRAGVVHRDLSPDNVILEEGSVEHAKLIDFGIAKSSSFGSGTLLQGQFAGKFNWVAPEQLGAFGGVVDGRSDVYSLALVTAAASRGEVLPMGASIVDAVSKRASVPDLTGVDPALVPLLTWMLQPDPAQRADSMARVIQALDNPAIIPGPPAPAQPDPNKTVIGGALPLADLPPIPAPREPSVAPMAPQTSVPVATNAPLGATVIAQVTAAPSPVAPARVSATMAAATLVEPDDSSPFGVAAPAARAASATQPALAVKPTSGGKGGKVAAAVVVLAGLGAGGAWVAGVFGPPTPPAAEAPVAVASSDQQPTAKTDEKAAAKAAADAAAAEKAAADAEAEKAAADKAAADAADAEKAAADKAAADKAAADKAAADAAALAQTDAFDPLASQNGHLAALVMPACGQLELTEARADGFAMNGFAADPATLQRLSDEWLAASKVDPVIIQTLVEPSQCPALDFAASLPRRPMAGFGLSLDKGATQKGGTAISGTITGSAERPLSLLLINEAGGVSDLSPFITSKDGKAQFSFMLTLPENAQPTRQALLVLASDADLAAALRDLPAQSDAGAVFEFLTQEAAAVEGGAQAALSAFDLEP